MHNIYPWGAPNWLGGSNVIKIVKDYKKLREYEKETFEKMVKQVNFLLYARHF